MVINEIDFTLSMLSLPLVQAGLQLSSVLYGDKSAPWPVRLVALKRCMHAVRGPWNNSVSYVDCLSGATAPRQDFAYRTASFDYRPVAVLAGCFYERPRTRRQLSPLGQTHTKLSRRNTGEF